MTRGRKKLHMPKGTDEVNYGTEKYPVDISGNVEVPDEAAGPLLKEGGAIEINEDVQNVEVVGELMVTISHIDKSASISHDGVLYTLDDDGYGQFPSSLAYLLETHGFYVVEL